MMMTGRFLPTFSLILAGSALGTAAVPIMAEASNDGDLTQAFQHVLGWVGLLSLFAAILFASSAPTLLATTSQLMTAPSGLQAPTVGSWCPLSV